ncbi:MAG TPA: HPP family protein [Limnobacter sp.]|nr:HPP family protein [Limnobacter sp.]
MKISIRNLRTLSLLRSIVGFESSNTSPREKLISGIGAFLGIAMVCWVSSFVVQGTDAILVVASMGATAVLLFAVPHGTLSQPWALMGGHFVSAVIGLVCARNIPNVQLAAALAVGLSVAAMYWARCIHPPGGATALTAVLGGDSISSLGYWYMINPVLLNTLAILLVAVCFNALFPWRRYPNHFARKQQRPVKTLEETGASLTHEDFAAAIAHLDSYVDVSADVLAELFEHATRHAEAQVSHPQALAVGAFYSNGQVGYRWCVRELLDMSSPRPGQSEASRQVIFKNVAGAGLYETGLTNSEAFRRWARYEVVLKNGRWLPVSRTSATNTE